MSDANRHYVLAAGGTGGHLIPAFALAVELERRGHHVALITDARGADIPGKPDFLPAHVLPAGRFGKNPMTWFAGVKAVLEGRRMALRLFETFEPSAVVGFGGYPALPALLAATSAGIPSIVHEQNAVLGRVNRLLAGRVQAIATAYPEVKRLKPKYYPKEHLVGNPVRAEVLALRDEPFPPFTDDGLLRVLVTGGSQGARVLSDVVPDGLAMLQPALRSRLQVTQQCRPEDIDAVRERYRSHDIPAELGTYFEDMNTRLADAHLFIGRAGASTIAELTAVGRPAILVPLPIATDDHQHFNTREVVKAGGARSIRQANFTPTQVAKQIQAMAQRPETLATAAHASWNCGRPKAASDLADLVTGFGGSELMDVIRVGGNNARGASQGEMVGQGAATRDEMS
ncbi:undecaprenyldiphospho-muramoylpentapeptide beta-N-acetylglucosaminyltransferase [Altererythrobacter confluentis]|uniref:UDP-N-acetylglucosamine--N-acetylmuramyl-(pentapeptide) pyrophosphoryl-undecaprenol N-acetylglucosamine transferase n=1 Tax=Allopontixanthobacter confluentis TaxID=1849021 RepID=A0A6L7GBY3_9SPHN|nr:undecaprenyldiphospho-muramoylpentapeptide beta-N-acetylglucosaminyltransferase [Allopontixanthobacter confluentis]MXP13483.1 undecaprenyldiphospho-muramoylpentapeptide beta-N-acetylglucosaminyltransferase [Allopontixanthobacter confluentis]